MVLESLLLLFDTVYAEGQRRYVESLSAYARQFLDMQNKPDVESITGLSPAIAIDQKTTSKNPRSTVGTVTEIYDYLRLLFSRIGVPYSPATGKPIESQTISQMVDGVKKLPIGTKIYILSPIVRGQKGEHRKEISALQKDGYTRLRVDGNICEISNMPTLDRNKKHTMDVVVDRLVIKEDLGNRLSDSIETAVRISKGMMIVQIADLPKESKESGYKKGEDIVFSEKFACPVSGFSMAEIEPRIFSFNSPYGACKSCNGLGTELYFDPNLVVPDVNLTLSEGAIAPWSKKSSPSENSRYQAQTLEGLARHL